ncbi:MAG: IPT/TIG domain-containing protein [Bacteroidota bacterium]
MKKIFYLLIVLLAVSCSKLEIERVDAKIDSISPVAAVPGSTVTITGVNFTETTIVTFGSTQAELTSVSDDQITVIVPTSLNEGDFELSVTSRSVPAISNFEVLPFFEEKVVHPLGFSSNINPSGFVLNDQVYLGTREVTTSFDDFYVYNTESNSWGRLDSDNNLPSANSTELLESPNGFTANGKGYIVRFGELWEFDPDTKSWTELASPPVNSTTSLVIGNNVYFVQDDFFGNTVWRYSINNDQWTQMNDFAGGIRAGASGFVIDGVAYLGQGLDRDLNDFYNDLWRYSEETDTWIEMSSPTQSTGIQYGVGFSLNGKGYIGLGRTIGSVTTFYQYTPETNSWRVVSDLPADPRVFTRAFVANDKVYLMYGSDEVGSNIGTRVDEVWEFTPETF